MRPRLDKFKNKKVVVIAAGITYKGVLREVTEEGVSLRGLTGWIEIPMEKVTSISLETDKERFGNDKIVDPSFWDMPPEEK